jgi:hypothetical protein
MGVVRLLFWHMVAGDSKMAGPIRRSGTASTSYMKYFVYMAKPFLVSQVPSAYSLFLIILLSLIHQLL